jgi:GTP cyclohydrolase IA
MKQIILTRSDIIDRSEKIVEDLILKFKSRYLKIYGVPRGGIPVAYEVAAIHGNAAVVYNVTEADVIVDDIIDSGTTRKRYGEPFYALIEKSNDDSEAWYVFPWEVDALGSQEDIVIRQLQAIGENPKRDGLLDTPRRVVKSWDDLYSGYKMDPKEILCKQFENEEHYDEMVISREIDFFSSCEHHLMPFFGQVHIAYIPKDKIVGLSKLARLVECFARRLQIQERMTQQIANAIQECLDPAGVAVYIEGKHLCQSSRGVQKHNAVMVTSALKGVFENQASRMEFLMLSKSR